MRREFISWRQNEADTVNICQDETKAILSFQASLFTSFYFHLKRTLAYGTLLYLMAIMFGCGKEKTPPESLPGETKVHGESSGVLFNAMETSFTIDSVTGNVIGCPLIEYIGEYNYSLRSNPVEKSKSLISRIKRIVTVNYKEKWYALRTDTNGYALSEEEHDGMGPIGWLETHDGGFVIPLGYPHGGDLVAVLFFDSDEELVNSYTLDRTMSVPEFDLNMDRTLCMISSLVAPEFNIFATDGQLIFKGDNNVVTGSNYTSYGRNYISQTGEYIILSNMMSYVFKHMELADSIKGHGYFINETTDLLYYVSGFNSIYIRDLIARQNVYAFNGKGRNGMYMMNDTILVHRKNKKSWMYKIK